MVDGITVLEYAAFDRDLPDDEARLVGYIKVLNNGKFWSIPHGGSPLTIHEDLISARDHLRETQKQKDEYRANGYETTATNS